MNEQQLREQICTIGQLMHRQGYIDGNSGNISARLTDGGILTTPSGLAKGFMTPGQLIIVDMDGRRIDAPTAENAHLRPTSELPMHLECYRQRDDVAGVVHAHPPTTIAMSIAGFDYQTCLIPEAVVLLGLIPTTPYATPAGPENRDAISELIRHHDVIVLAYHGSLTVSGDVWDAYMRLESLEHTANILFRVQQLGGPKSPLPPHQIEKLIAMREKMGLLKPGDADGFYAACGMPQAGRVDENGTLEARIRQLVRETLAELQP